MLYLLYIKFLIYITNFVENIESDSSIKIPSNMTEEDASKISYVKQYDPTIDERLPQTVTLLTTPDGGKLYLIGTAHFSVESQNDVSKVTGI